MSKCSCGHDCHCGDNCQDCINDVCIECDCENNGKDIPDSFTKENT